MRMPKTREEYETDMLSALKSGMNYGYAVEHTNIREDENNAILDYAKWNDFKTDAVKKALFDDFSGGIDDENWWCSKNYSNYCWF